MSKLEPSLDNQQFENDNEFLQVNPGSYYSMTLGKEEAVLGTEQNHQFGSQLQSKINNSDKRSEQCLVIGGQSNQLEQMPQDSNVEAEVVNPDEENQFMMDHNSLVASINKGLRQSHSHIDSQNQQNGIMMVNKDDKESNPFGMQSVNKLEQGQEHDEEDMLKESACFGGGIQFNSVESIIEHGSKQVEKQEKNIIKQQESGIRLESEKGEEQQQENEFLCGELNSKMQNKSQPISQVESQEQIPHKKQEQSEKNMLMNSNIESKLQSKVQSYKQKQKQSYNHQHQHQLHQKQSESLNANDHHFQSNSALTANNRQQPDILDCPDLPQQNFGGSLSEGQQYSSHTDPFAGVQSHQEPSSNNFGPSRQQSEVNQYNHQNHNINLNLNVYHSPKKIKQINSEQQDEKVQKRPDKSSIIHKIYVNEDVFLGGESHQPEGSHISKPKSSRGEQEMLQSDVQPLVESHHPGESHESVGQRSSFSIKKSEKEIQPSQQEYSQLPMQKSSQEQRIILSAEQELFIEQIQSNQLIKENMSKKKIIRRVKQKSQLKNKQKSQIDRLINSGLKQLPEGSVHGSKMDCTNHLPPQSEINHQTPKQSKIKLESQEQKDLESKQSQNQIKIETKEDMESDVFNEQIPKMREKSSLQQLHSIVQSNKSQEHLKQSQKQQSYSIKHSIHHSERSKQQIFHKEKSQQQSIRRQSQNQGLSHEINKFGPSFSRSSQHQQPPASQAINNSVYSHISHHSNSSVSKKSKNIIENPPQNVSIDNSRANFSDNFIHNGSSAKKQDVQTGNLLASGHNEPSLSKEESSPSYHAEQSEKSIKFNQQFQKYSSNNNISKREQQQLSGQESDREQTEEKKQSALQGNFFTHQLKENISKKQLITVNSPRKQQGNTVFNSYPLLHEQKQYKETFEHIPKEEPHQDIMDHRDLGPPVGSAKTNHRHNKILSYKERSPLTDKKKQKIVSKHESQEDQIERIRLLKQAHKKRLERQLEKVEKQLQEINSKEKKMEKVYGQLHKLQHEHEQQPKRQGSIHQKRRQKQSEQIMKMLKQHRKFKAQQQLQFQDIDKNITNNLQELTRIRKEAEQKKKQQKRLQIMERMKKNQSRKLIQQKKMRANNQYVQQFKSETQIQTSPKQQYGLNIPKSPLRADNKEQGKLLVHASPKIVGAGSSRQQARIPKLKSLSKKEQNKYENRLA